MNLVDITSIELQQDEWTLTRPKFGVDSQIEVIGWSGRNRNRVRSYIVKCSICEKDDELFGKAFFRTVKGSLVNGFYPCGCSNAPVWSPEQQVIRAQRAANDLGYKFLSVIDEPVTTNSKIKLHCGLHGEWETATINGLVCRGAQCPTCVIDKLKHRSKKSDDEMISSFLASGAFSKDTKFSRSERTNRRGHHVYWDVYCPNCENTSSSYASSLQKGSVPCECGRYNQKLAYINLIKDKNDLDIALKFGITSNIKIRINFQNYKNMNISENMFVYRFNTKEQCKRAETECKQTLECGIIAKQDMPDGYTETTYIYNLDRIIEIYERNGGIRCEDQF